MSTQVSKTADQALRNQGDLVSSAAERRGGEVDPARMKNAAWTLTATLQMQGNNHRDVVLEDLRPLQRLLEETVFGKFKEFQLPQGTLLRQTDWE